MTPRSTTFIALLTSLVSLVAPARAGVTPTLQNLDSSQTTAVLKTFGANFAFRPLETPSDYGRNLGFAIGLGGGLTSASAITEAIPGVTMSQIPNANVILGLQLPKGFGIEAGFLPQVSVSGLSFNSWGGDVKWNAGAGLGKLLPVDVAVRAMYSKTSMSYSQTVTSPAPATGTIALSTQAWGVNVSASKKLPLIEPYAGFGWISQTGELSQTGSLSLFNTSLTTSNSWSTTNSGLWAFAGLQVRLFVFNLTTQYDSQMGIGTTSVKLGLKI
jgi:hypothetical protein